jgi:hypothetical protein
MKKLGVMVALFLMIGSASAQDYYGGGAPPPAQYGFVGLHPIPYEAGSGICYQQGAHFHAYAPFDQYLFRESGGYFYFVGDLGDFGYTSTSWNYNGNHPIPAGYGSGYCYMDWGHRHHYAPPPGYAFNYVGGYYVYGGGWDPSYYTYRDRYRGYYGGYYRNNYYGGRYWSVRPSHIYRPSFSVGMPGVYGGGSVTITPPRPAYVAPPPTYVAPPRPAYVAPPPTYVAPPRPTYVAPPAPTYVAPRPAYVAPPRPAYVAPPRPAYVAPPRVYVAPPRRY